MTFLFLGWLMWSLTKRKIKKLGVQVNERKRFQRYSRSLDSPKDICHIDLDEFLKAWEVCTFY